VSIPGAADAERALLSSMHDVDLAAATTGASPAGGSPISLNTAPPHPELNAAVSLRMKAPLDDVARALADKVGYRFSSNAVAGADPVTMELDGQNVPVLDLLRHVGTQAASRADVVVRPDERLIVVVHHA
jgi:hypothetical protein